MNDPQTSEAIKRLHMYFHHVGLIYAWSEKAPAIEMYHLEAAVQVINTSHQFILSLLESQQANAEPPAHVRFEMGVDRRILDKVERNPGITKREVCKSLWRIAPARSLSQAVANLVNAGGLIVRRQGKQGRTEGLYIA